MDIEQINLGELLTLFREQLAIVKNQQKLIEQILTAFEDYAADDEWGDLDDEDLEEDYDDDEDYPPSPKTSSRRTGLHDAPDAFSGGAGVEPE